MNNKPNDTRLIYDSCSYNEKLKRTIGPGLYALNTPYNDCVYCPGMIQDDPALRYQSYGHSTCSMKEAVDDSSELLGLNYKKTKCSTDEYRPGGYQSKGPCLVNTTSDPRQCFAPREDTRISNPANTLKGTGINRWEWLPEDPQEKALEAFDRIPVNYRMVAKDNHVPIIEEPMDQSRFFPKSNVTMDDPLKEWKKGNALDMYAPGNPLGSINVNHNCKGKFCGL